MEAQTEEGGGGGEGEEETEAEEGEEETEEEEGEEDEEGGEEVLPLGSLGGRLGCGTRTRVWVPKKTGIRKRYRFLLRYCYCRSLIKAPVALHNSLLPKIHQRNNVHFIFIISTHMPVPSISSFGEFFNIGQSVQSSAV